MFTRTKPRIWIDDLNKNLTNGKSHAHMVYTVILLVKGYTISLPTFAAQGISNLTMHK